MISFPHWHLSSVLFYITCILQVIWAYPNVNQHFSSKSQSECPSVCPVLFRFQQNLCLEFSAGKDDPHKPVNQVLCTQDTESDEYETPLFSPVKLDDLIGCTFLTRPTEDGQCFHAQVICHIEKINDTTDKIPDTQI